MTNGAVRMEYPEPLVGDAANRDMQLRNYIFRLTDYINRLTSRIEDLERAQAGNEGA
jgi:hypothetical protein